MRRIDHQLLGLAALIVRQLAAMVEPKPQITIDAGDEIAAVRRINQA
jgi:hypothetical protein